MDAVTIFIIIAIGFLVIVATISIVMFAIESGKRRMTQRDFNNVAMMSYLQSHQSPSPSQIVRRY